MNTETVTFTKHTTPCGALTISQELKENIEQRIKTSIMKSEEITDQLRKSLT
jgi:hypothetical protein